MWEFNSKLGCPCYIAPPDGVRRSEVDATVGRAPCKNKQVGTALGNAVQQMTYKRPSRELKAWRPKLWMDRDHKVGGMVRTQWHHERLSCRRTLLMAMLCPTCCGHG